MVIFLENLYVYMCVYFLLGSNIYKMNREIGMDIYTLLYTGLAKKFVRVCLGMVFFEFILFEFYNVS